MVILGLLGLEGEVMQMLAAIKTSTKYLGSLKLTFMNFSLTSTKKSIEQFKIRITKSSDYKLFAFLLATPADRKIIPEICLYFNEIDRITGNEVLFFAPKVYIGIEDIFNCRQASFQEAIEIFRTGMYPKYMGYSTIEVDVSKSIDEFLKEQEEVTYDLIEFLHLPYNISPSIVFFERLNFFSDFVVWELTDNSGNEVIRDLRDIIETLHDKCNWRLKERIEGINGEIKYLTAKYENPKYRSIEFYSLIDEMKYLNEDISELSFELEELRGIEKDKIELEKTKILLPYLIKKVRESIDKYKNENEKYKMPFAIIFEHIKVLEIEPLNHDKILYLKRHRRRWKKRMPEDYLFAIENYLTAIDFISNVLINKVFSRNINKTIIQVKSNILAIEEKIKKNKNKISKLKIEIPKQIDNSKKEIYSNILRLERELKVLLSKQNEVAPEAIEVLSSFSKKRMIKKKLNKAGKIATNLSPIAGLFIGT